MNPNLPDDKFRGGSVAAFDESWAALPASNRYHFARHEPAHQVQFAFQNHFRVFQRVLGEVRAGRALEVGCGRGSMAAFFADAGFEAVMLDTSRPALELARANFLQDGLTGQPEIADALRLPHPDGSFDVVVSIGLFEHFADIAAPLREQVRVLRPGGVFLGYVVPERALSVQTLAAPLNALLKIEHRWQTRRDPKQAVPRKAPLYRNAYRARAYLNLLDGMGVSGRGAFGMFPLPMVSHSPSFPFTPMSPAREARLMRLWRTLLRLNPARPGGDPWTCPEWWGLAFLVWARK
ncbi:MAG: class I SAM-dependent methyltransferase [Chloroflexi bacterium]|nr:class I SAM-dependent methyltransferase [Chloroflexota bacterium]